MSVKDDRQKHRNTIKPKKAFVYKLQQKYDTLRITNINKLYFHFPKLSFSKPSHELEFHGRLRFTSAKIM